MCGAHFVDGRNTSELPKPWNGLVDYMVVLLAVIGVNFTVQRISQFCDICSPLVF